MAIEAGLLSRDEVGAALARMVENVGLAGAMSIRLTIYPPYPKGFFLNRRLTNPYEHQHGGDWTWFGARMVRQLIHHGFVAEAYREMDPMLQRVLDHDGFHDWYSLEFVSHGPRFRASAGSLGMAIRDLLAWARDRA